MNQKTTILLVVLCLGLILTPSCKKPKEPAIQEPVINTDQFTTSLPDGEYLMDSTAGIKTYALVEGSKLKQFRATTLDGKPSSTGYVNLRLQNQALVDGPTAEEECINKMCIWACLAPVSTNAGSTEICNCVCPGNPPTPDNSIWGMMSPDMLGPSFKDTKVAELTVRLKLALGTATAQ